MPIGRVMSYKRTKHCYKMDYERKITQSKRQAQHGQFQHKIEILPAPPVSYSTTTSALNSLPSISTTKSIYHQLEAFNPTETDLFIGYFEDVLPSVTSIKNFKKDVLPYPKSMTMISLKNRKLPKFNLPKNKSCRSISVRFKNNWWSDIIQENGSKNNQTPPKASSQVGKLINELIKDFQNLEKFYKPNPEYKFLILNCDSHVDACMAYFGQLKNWKIVQLSLYGKKEENNFFELECNRKISVFKSEMGLMMRNVVCSKFMKLNDDEESNPKVIDCDNL